VSKCAYSNKKGNDLKSADVQILLPSAFLTAMFLLSGCNAGTFAGATAPVVTPSPSVLLLPGQTVQFSATVNGGPVANPVWSVNSTAGGTTATGTITLSGLYTAPGTVSSTPVQVSVTDFAQNTHSTPVQVSFFQPDHFQPGSVSSSNNPLVALYALNTPQGALTQIQFGTTTSYGLTTWAQPAPVGGGQVSIIVAGMRANTTYHMQALVHLPDGKTVADADQVFTTGSIPADLLPNITVQQTPGIVPASGVEMLCLFEEASQTQLTAVITDLSGNVIWYYPIQPNSPFPMKLLPNGHILVNNTNTAQEIDLAGNILSQVSLSDIQQGLTTAGISFPPLNSMHHDFLKLPNGHLILLVNFFQPLTDQPGASPVLGDGLIDWDPQRGPVWTWSTFDHIPLSHAPNGTGDWTHANAVVYSPDDGNLLLSMRNQNWVIKINYQDGTGDGRILWHLGQDGDFSLPAGQAPIEWNYGQHYPTFLSANTSGTFSLMFFNNGNNRQLDADNDDCGTTGFMPCYSSVPTLELNEFANTAQVLEETNLSPAFSFCCGNAERLSNGNLEYDVAADVSMPGVSYIQEVTPELNPQLVWQMNITGQLAYRGFRIPSLYPGIEWTQSAIATASANAIPQSRRTAVKQ
jgi:arylsulfate sulfotransferase